MTGRSSIRSSATSWDAVDAAIGAEIVFPRGRMRFTGNPIHLKKRVRLIGEAGGIQTQGKGSEIVFADNQDGFVVNKSSTNNGTVIPSDGLTAAGTSFENLFFRPLDKNGPTGTDLSQFGSGIRLRSIAVIRSCHFDGFGESGIIVEASTATAYLAGIRQREQLPISRMSASGNAEATALPSMGTTPIPAC